MSNEKGYFLRRESEGKPTAFQGEITFREIVGVFFITPNPNKKDPVKSPDFIFKMWNHTAQDWEAVGMVKIKPLRAGGEYFSIAIKDEDKGLTHWFGGFADDEQPKDAPKNKPANYNLRFQNTTDDREYYRRRQNGGAAPAPAPVVMDLNDEVPF